MVLAARPSLAEVPLADLSFTQAANAAPGGRIMRTLVMPKWQYSPLRICLFKG